MKILHIINSLATGGAEKLLLDTIPLYNKKLIQCDLLVFHEINCPFMNLLKDKKCCKIFNLHFKSVYNPVIIFKIIPYLKQYDIVHVHLFPAQYWVVLAKILSFSKVKLIFTEHSTSNRRLKNKFFRVFDLIIYFHYKKIICITKNVKNELLSKLKLNYNKLIIIQNGVELDSIYQSKPYLKEDIIPGIFNNDNLLIQIGGFRIEKDQITTIKSLLHLENNVKLILVGIGILENKCKLLVKNLNLEQRVFFLGLRMDIPSLLKTADISIVSSHWEGFGLVAVEGMASGKPVIASDVDGLNYVVSGGGILFEKGNAKKLAEIITKLFEDEILFNQTVKNCKIKALEYDINKMIDNTIDLYKILNN